MSRTCILRRIEGFNRRCCLLAACRNWGLRTYPQFSTWKTKTIPRIELCAAVLGIEVSDIIKEQLDVPSECFRFYTDSQIVLGYLTNTTRRFYVYVSNRVNRIRLSSSPNQWTHVPTEQNPADQATRSVSALHLANSMWLSGHSCDILTKI